MLKYYFICTVLIKFPLQAFFTKIIKVDELTFINAIVP